MFLGLGQEEIQVGVGVHWIQQIKPEWLVEQRILLSIEIWREDKKEEEYCWRQP